MTTRQPQPQQPRDRGDLLPGGPTPPKKAWQKWAWIGGGLFALIVLAGLCAGPDEQRATQDIATPSPTVTTQTPSPEPTVAAVPTAPPDAVAVLAAQVTRVIDGDTAEMMVNGQRESVRFIGMDAAEPGRPYSAEATAYVRERIEGKQVFLEKDVSERDPFGRLLRYVWYVDPTRADEAEVREQQLNGRMVLDGFATLATFPPDVKYVSLLTKFQQEARTASRGLWAAPVTTTTTSPRIATPTTNRPPTTTTMPAQSGCHSSYEGACVPIASDVDCPGGSGNGPAYAPGKDFRVVGPDVYDLDRDGDGIACES